MINPCYLFADDTGDPDSYPVLYRGATRADSGRWWVTDRAVLIYTDQMTDPLALPTPRLATREQTLYVAPALVATVIHERPERLFQARYLDVLEEAGYRVRPLYGQADVHAVLPGDTDQVVGLLQPMRYDYDGSDLTRTATR